MLHIDLNVAAPEAFALERMWGKVVPGGVVLLNGYAFHGHDDHYASVNAVAVRLGIRILSTPTGQGIAIK
jgi:hypothetical protein